MTGRRRADVTSRAFAVDALNRSLLSDFLPVQGARGFGLYLLDRIAPLRRAVMREGVEPAAQPRLMRGEALLARANRSLSAPSFGDGFTVPGGSRNVAAIGTGSAGMVAPDAPET